MAETPKEAPKKLTEREQLEKTAVDLLRENRSLKGKLESANSGASEESKKLNAELKETYKTLITEYLELLKKRKTISDQESFMTFLSQLKDCGTFVASLSAKKDEK